MKNVYPSLVVLTLFLALISCQKDVSDPVDPVTKCRITTSYYYGGSGMINDSAVYTYGPDQKLNRVESEFEYVIYTYTGDKITMRQYYDKSMNELVRADTIAYSGNNISSIRSFEFYSNWGIDSLYTQAYFTWQGTRLEKIIYIELAPASYNTYTTTRVSTNAAGNIEKMVFFDEFDFPLDSVTYNHDAQPNYFKAYDPHFFLVDPFFQMYAGFEPNFALFYSTNNVNKFTIYGMDDYQITYDLDSSTNVSGLKLDGADYMRYKYSCQ